MNKVLGNKKSIAVFVLPAFCIYAVFVLIPIGYNVYMSFLQTDLMSPSKFIGMKNYINLFRDKTFIEALGNNVILVIGSLVANLPIALLLGNILFQKIKGSHFFQTVFFLPSVICGVAIGLAWTFIYNSEFGILNKLLETVGLEDLQHIWLADKKLAMFCIMIVVMWQFIGYHMIIQIAAMKNIPESYYEAARIDGAGQWEQFKKITFPLIKPILKVDAVLIVTSALKYYDLVAVMTEGGPDHATELLSTYMYYQGFRTLKYGYSASIGVVLLLLCICSVLLSNFIFRSEPTEY